MSEPNKSKSMCDWKFIGAAMIFDGLASGGNKLTAAMLNFSELEATSSTLVQTAGRLAMYGSPIGAG